MTRRSLALGAVSCALLLFACPWMAIAASPSPTPPPAVDPRGGPTASMTGEPLLAAVSVIMLGVATAAVTTVVIRMMPKRE